MKRIAVAVLVLVAAPAVAGELILRPQPCRILDTRLWEGPVGANTRLPFALNPEAAPGQGGEAGCGVPATAEGAKLLVHAAPTASAGGVAKVGNPVGDPGPGIFASLVLEGAGQYASIQLDTPLSFPKLAYFQPTVQAHAVVELVGWIDPCVPQKTLSLAYSQTSSRISVLEGEADLARYVPGGSIWLAGDASQPGRYVITAYEVSAGRERLTVSPTPQSATDQALEVHLLPGGCTPHLWPIGF